MPVSAGTRLGPYEIVSALGAGGMGEVYRARDTRLERTVAIKVLPGHFSSDPNRRERFEREARAISALSHPHICVLHDVGQQDGCDFLVMEFLEGETLAERLDKGPLPVEQVVKVGMQIADALEKAHSAGIIHRDLKPGNIMLTKSGAKLMDFGLAKAVEDQASVMAAATAAESLTQMARSSKPLTGQGTVVGTFQYMSPEQLEGRDITPRSDIFALGAVLYEMATGRRAFQGRTQASIIAAVLASEPPPAGSLQPLTPPALEQLIRTCLAKDPEERWQTAHDVKLQLRAISEGSSQTAATASPARIGRKNRERLAWSVAALAAVLLVVLAALYFAPHQSQVVRTHIPAPAKTNFVFMGDAGGPVVISPDGKTLAFVAASSEGAASLWVRPLDSLEAHALPGTENAWGPFWSPDSRFIGFAADGKLKTIDINGGRPFSVCDSNGFRGGSWGRDGTIIFAPDFRDPIYRVSAAGGTPVPITRLEAKYTSHRWPVWLPDGKHFLYLAVNHEVPRSESDALYFASLDGKENRSLMSSFANAAYVPGFLMYLRDNQLVAQPFDAAKGVLSGDPQRVADGVANDITTWRGVFSASTNGILAYSGGGQSESQLAWFDRAGKQLATVGDKIPGLNNVTISHRGDRIAISIQASVTDIWVMDIKRGVRTRLSFGPKENTNPVWSFDDAWVAYSSLNKDGSRICRRPAIGGPEEVLLMTGSTPVYPTSWSPDGKYLLFEKGPQGGRQEVWALPLAGDRKPFQVVAGGAYFSNEPSFSPDGRWILYSSNESGRSEVYVVRFGGSAGKWQVSAGGAISGRWRRDGKEIYFVAANNMLTAVPVRVGPNGFETGAPQPLFPALISNGALYDPAPDGQRFLFDTAAEQRSEPIALVLNWTADLKH